MWFFYVIVRILGKKYSVCKFWGNLRETEPNLITSVTRATPVYQQVLNLVSAQQELPWNQLLPSVARSSMNTKLFFFFLQKPNKIHPKRHPSHFFPGQFCYLSSLRNACCRFCFSITVVQTLLSEYFPKKAHYIHPLSMTRRPQQSHLLTFVCGFEEEGGYDSNAISTYGCCMSCL